MADLRLQSYLSQQLMASDDSNSVIQQTPIPTDEELDQFKNYVKNFIDIDNDVKKLKGAIRERNSVKKEISSFIVAFMGKFNIEDLNTKQGKIRYQITHVKRPLTEKTIKTRLLENHTPNISPEDLSSSIFDTRQTVPRHVLKRMHTKS
jgi:seryl-tRNA synthetase